MTINTYASLRFTGDGLEPALVSDIVQAPPSMYYCKDDTFFVGKSHKRRIGRTGLWLLSTEGLFGSSENIYEHLNYVIRALIGDNEGKINARKALSIYSMNQSMKLDMRVSLFWHGPNKRMTPEIGTGYYKLIKLLGGYLETDFGSDDLSENGEPRAA